MGKLRKLDKERRRLGEKGQSLLDDVRGKTGQLAAEEAGELQAVAAEEAGGLFDPFQQIGQTAFDDSGFLTDPQAQFDFLQENPLFQEALDNANRNTLKMAAARGRLSAGDTLQSLSGNTLLAASPLIQQQKQSILDQLGFGERSAVNRANLVTGAGAARAGGIVGGANARTAGTQNLLNLGTQIAGSLSGIPVGAAPGFDGLTQQNTSGISSLISGNLRAGE